MGDVIDIKTGLDAAKGPDKTMVHMSREAFNQHRAEAFKWGTTVAMDLLEAMIEGKITKRDLVQSIRACLSIIETGADGKP